MSVHGARTWEPSRFNRPNPWVVTVIVGLLAVSYIVVILAVAGVLR